MAEEQLSYSEIVGEEKCKKCGVKAPKRQIENLGVCERCSLDGYTTDKTGETLNPENNIVDKWKRTQPTQENAIKSTM